MSRICYSRSQGLVEITMPFASSTHILINASLCLESAAKQAHKKYSFYIQEFHQHPTVSFVNLFVVVKIPPWPQPPKSSQQQLSSFLNFWRSSKAVAFLLQVIFRSFAYFSSVAFSDFASAKSPGNAQRWQ